MQKDKRIRCLYVRSAVNNKETVSLDLQEALCRSFASKQGWTICKESWASLFLDDKVTPNIFKQFIDICCTAALSEFDLLLIASGSCLGMPEAYFDQVIQWLRENNVETWSAREGRLA